MNDRKINNKLIESILMIAIVTTLSVLGIGFIPHILLFPAMFTIFSIRNGNNLGLTSIIISAVATVIISNSIELGIYLLITTLPMTILLSNLIVNRVKSSEVILYNSILFFITILAMIKIMELSGINFVEMLEKAFNDAILRQVEIYKGMGLSSLELSENKDVLENTYKYAMLIIPSILLILSLVVSYINYVLINIGLEKMELRLANTPRLSRFRLPNNFIYFIGLILLASIFIPKLESPFLETIFLNIQLLIGSAFIIQGLSVIDHILVRKRIKLWIRTLSYFIFIFFPPIISILPIVGIMDMVFDFKKLKGSKP